MLNESLLIDRIDWKVCDDLVEDESQSAVETPGGPACNLGGDPGLGSRMRRMPTSGTYLLLRSLPEVRNPYRAGAVIAE